MPSYPNFVGTSNTLEPPRADTSRLVNMYYTASDVQTGKPALCSMPGAEAFVTLTGDSDVRALASENGRTFSVIGTTLVEVFSAATLAQYASVIKNANPAQIVFNGITGGQALIASGNNAYSLNLATNVLSAPVLTGEAQQIGMLDGYGLALHPTTGRLRLSNLNDFGTWDPTQFAVRSSAPDRWIALLVNAPDVWLIGSLTGDVWFDAGTSPFPFAPRPGATFKYGIAAPFSLAAAGDSVLWLSQNTEGAGIVVRARGYTPQPVSSYALSLALAQYQDDATISDAEAFAFQWQGHVFYVLSFPTANATWIYDLATGLWSERGVWNSAENQYDTWNVRAHTHAFGLHLIGGAGSGIIGELDAELMVELNGAVQRRMRIPPALQPGEGQRLVVDRFELGVDAGLGATTGQGSDPMVMLRVSNTFGKYWSNERRASFGPIGRYNARCFWTRNGSSTQCWLPEVVISDPAILRLTGAMVMGSGFGEGF